MIDRSCPKCKSKMEKGAFSGNPTEWQSPTNQPFLKSSGRQIEAYACVKCGFIECYVQTDENVV